MIDDHVENDTNGKWMAVLLEIVCSVDEIDEILFGSEMGIDAKVIVDVVAVVGVVVVLEYRREPDGRTAEAGDVIEVAADAFNIAAEEGIRSFDAGRAIGASGDRARGVVLETIDHEEVDKLFAPLAFGIEVLLAGNRREIDLLN